MPAVSGSLTICFLEIALRLGERQHAPPQPLETQQGELTPQGIPGQIAAGAAGACERLIELPFQRVV